VAQLLILDLNHSCIERVWLSGLHLLAVLSLFLVALEVLYVGIIAGLIFLNLMFAWGTLPKFSPPQLRTIIISGDKLTLVGGRNSQTARLINARVCGDFFTLLEYVAIDNPSQSGLMRLIRGRRTILILSVMIGRKAHCRLRRYLRFSAWRRDVEGQPLV